MFVFFICYYSMGGAEVLNITFDEEEIKKVVFDMGGDTSNSIDGL